MTLVCAMRYSSPQQAFLAAGALRAQGIDAEVFDHNHIQTVWHLQQAVQCRVMVDEADLTEARRFISEAEGRPVEPEPITGEPHSNPLKRWTFAIWMLLSGG